MKGLSKQKQSERACTVAAATQTPSPANTSSLSRNLPLSISLIHAMDVGASESILASAGKWQNLL
jgi:hypothetical protein